MKYSYIFTKDAWCWLKKYRNDCIKVASNALLTFVFTALPIQQSMAVGLSQTPVFTQFSAKPNVITVVDDSGSMDAETLMPTNDGAMWWGTTNESYADSGSLHGNFAGSANSSWKKYIYLFPNGTGTAKRVYGDSTHDHYAVPPFIQYAFTRSADFNNAYYDPDQTYEPWIDYGGTDFDNISATAAPSDPVTGAGITLDLTHNRENKNSNNTFRIQDGMVMPKGTRYYSGSWKTRSSDKEYTSVSNVGVSYYPATYYVKVTSGTYTVNGTAGDCSAIDAAHYSLLRADPSTFTSSDADALAYDGTCLKKVEVKSTNAPFTNSGDRTDCNVSNSCTYAEEIQNFANWYSYYRKRHLALRAGMGEAFDGMADMRVGVFTINHRNNVSMIDLDTDSDDFYSTMYAIDGNSGGTPNRTALKYAGTQYMRNDAEAPITAECQKNFTLQFTDGFSTLSSDGVGNADSAEGAPYADTYSNTLADVAMYYYKQNLRPELTEGEVPVPSGCSLTTPDPILDCNENLHMNTYTVALSATGDSVFGITHFDVQDAYDTTPTWPDPNSNRDKTQVDDLYHAAVNGRGEMYNADTPKDLQESLKSALSSIKSQTGSASSATFNTSTLEAGSYVYLTLFNSSGWSGDLLSYALSAQGDVSVTSTWSAASKLDDRNLGTTPRVIITHDGSDGVIFDWATIGALGAGNVMYDDLAYGGAGDAEDRLDYIRGDRSMEGAGQFRVRNSRMGDIVHSAAIYVGKPELRWPDTLPSSMVATETPDNSYSVFKSATSRTGVIYVGGNDGMLHGFNGSSGEEVIAYIPHVLYSDAVSSGLHYLTEADYQHKFYVDLTPAVSDVVISQTWKTVLIGSLGAGGKGIFALDVTDPSTFSEANAADIALWEFSSDDDSGLGYTFSDPVLTMTNSGKWAVILGNGYNSDADTASLFILYVSEGIDGTWGAGDYVKLTTDATITGNGLSSPSVIDNDGDGDADLVYAGDLKGNLWKFDIRSSDSTEWTTTKLFSAGATKPITTAPSVTDHPTVSGDYPNLMIFFGTGQYLSIGDVTDDATQSYFGIWDNGDNDLLPYSRLEQFTITSIDDGEGRIVTGTVPDYTANGVNKKYGWYINLPDSGERVITNSIARGDLIFFNTSVPSTDPCAAGGYGWNMVVDANSGGPPETPAFDYNGDGVVDEDDNVDYGGEEGDKSPVGKKYDDGGLPSGPSILGNKQYTTGTETDDGGDIDVTTIAPPPANKIGRLSWEQIFD